jgi:hypothetical protein
MASAPITSPAAAQQVSVTSPSQLRSANAPFSQSLARDIETITYQLNQLAKSVGSTLQNLPGLVFGTWLNWTPAITAWLSMTVSGVTITDAQYLQAGSIVYFKLHVAMTLGGTASNQIFIPLPLQVAGQSTIVSAAVNTGTGFIPAWCFCDPAGSICKVLLPNEVAYPLGACAVLVSGFYRCV